MIYHKIVITTGMSIAIMSRGQYSGEEVQNKERQFCKDIPNLMVKSYVKRRVSNSKQSNLEISIKGSNLGRDVWYLKRKKGNVKLSTPKSFKRP